jgi:3',5'-cyclic AMP phosphodiesterase CpdA
VRHATRIAILVIGARVPRVQAMRMQIALISDTHLMPTAPAFDANLAAARAFVVAHGITDTIHLGDITADGVKLPEHLDHARGVLADWPGTLHMLPGNHDIGDNPGDFGHATVTSLTLARYTAAFSSERWVLHRAGWRLIGLDAQVFGRGDALEEVQDRWLDRVLADVSGPIGLFLHKPLFRDDPADPDPHHRYVPLAPRTALLARFATLDLRFVVAGHTHQTRNRHVDGIEHVWLPSTAFILPNALQETIGTKDIGMMTLTLTEGAHAFELITPPGMVRHNLVDQAHVYPGAEAALRAAPRDAV